MLPSTHLGCCGSSWGCVVWGQLPEGRRPSHAGGNGGRGRPQPALSGSPHRLAWISCTAGPGVRVQQRCLGAGVGEGRVLECRGGCDPEECTAYGPGRGDRPAWVLRAHSYWPATPNAARGGDRNAEEASVAPEKGSRRVDALSLAEGPTNYPEPRGRIRC